MPICAWKVISMENIWVFCFDTVNPLYKILPLKTGNTTTCIINGLCSNCSHRQWYHFLISWLDEACVSGRACARQLQHTDPERMLCLLVSAQLFSDFLWFWPEAWSPDSSAVSRELALWVVRFKLTVPSLRNVRSYPHEGMSAGVCPIEQLRL